MRIEYLMDVYPWTDANVPPVMLTTKAPPPKNADAIRYLVVVEFPDPRARHDAVVQATVERQSPTGVLTPPGDHHTVRIGDHDMRIAASHP